ncbi:SMP-30/gluconolactonase/LRE family protein [Alsobacter sp. SYSU M60028]|uniref:SMP-30/gluconolactonase/LRE family protein n=1 Tax=Alsobacter ponti TaxID=2962936 RepID=A0ABT1LCQ0_9HYPH|nr:SMP-30/gluconolactonase/LRE family protein [Alsobacter ponti]MCP8938861.1 SMP-30/gluconolactonase/LRE family protein [Alsobacter ponti]
MEIVTPEVTRLIDVPLGTGEGPCWAADEKALYFVDIPAATLFRLDPATGDLRRFPMPSAIGSFGLAPGGRAVVALRDGVYMYDFATGALTLLARPEPDRPGNRLNDGKVAPDGRFWVGSMDDRPEKETVAALHCVDPDGTCRRMEDGLIVSNGLAFSPDGRTLFHSDSRQRFIRAYDYDLATGAISNRRHVRTMEEDEGRPDGAACDAEGYYWSAGVSAGCLNRIAPDGTLVRKVMLPVASPTMPCFGGPDLKTLYVTSLTTDRLGHRQEGTLISFPVDVPGAPVARFGEPILKG